MGKPTKEELETALEHAGQMREKGDDPFFIAKCLLNLNFRMKYLEEVLNKADLYLHSGEGAHEHAELANAIKRARHVELDPGGTDKEVPT